MGEWLSQYWYLLVVLIVVCVLAVVIFFFAVRAYSQHSKLFKAQEAEMKRLLALKEKYLDFTYETLAENEESELLEGVALSYQIRLQRQEEPERAYEEMSEEKKNIYVLDVFCADGDVKVFFSENGAIVKEKILPALEMIGMSDFGEKLKRIYSMYDADNEEVSFSESEIEEMNEYIVSENILSRIKLSGAKYIKNNFETLKN